MFMDLHKRFLNTNKKEGVHNYPLHVNLEKVIVQKGLNLFQNMDVNGVEQ
jgi:hypothetical protein